MRIGFHFAGIGLPAYAFCPLFNTIKREVIQVLWTDNAHQRLLPRNSSRGVLSFLALCSYMNESSEVMKLTNLSDIMRLFAEKLSLCLSTIAVSITCKAKMVDDKHTPDK